MAPVDLDQLARRFPLVPRPRPATLPLPQQLAEIAALARTPPEHPDASARIATAHNKAALIASNYGEPDLARKLCWHHHHRYAGRRPWTAREARFALEPLVNLARLESRASQPDAAIQILESLLTATSDGGIADIEGHPIDLGTTIATRDDRNALRRWIWTVTLAEGLRALARTGRWDDALTHAERHHGIGATLLDGRQIAILTHALRGDHRAARAMLTASLHTEQWHGAVARVLGLLISHRDGTPTQSEASMDFTSGRPSQSFYPTEIFGMEVRLAVVRLADDATRSATLRELTREAAEITDAGLARTILTHPTYCHLPRALLDKLTRVGLSNPLPVEELHTCLHGALTMHPTDEM